MDVSHNQTQNHCRLWQALKRFGRLDGGNKPALGIVAGKHGLVSDTALKANRAKYNLYQNKPREVAKHGWTIMHSMIDVYFTKIHSDPLLLSINHTRRKRAGRIEGIEGNVGGQKEHACPMGELYPSKLIRVLSYLNALFLLPISHRLPPIDGWYAGVVGLPRN